MGDIASQPWPGAGESGRRAGVGPAGGAGSRRRRAARLCLLFLAVLLLAEATLEADRLRKRMRRRFPRGWFAIPQVQFDLTFKAFGPRATVTFEAFDLIPEGGSSVGLCLDNIAIAERKFYRRHQAPDLDYEPTQCLFGSRLPLFESSFTFPTNPLPGPSDGVVFLDTFETDPATRWQGVDGSVVFWANPFPCEGSESPPCDAPYAPNGRCLALGGPSDDQATASFTVDNLVPGEIYVLSGWWHVNETALERPTVDLSITGDVFDGPRILLVDDDNNAPDVQPFYTDALDAMGLRYVLWDPGDVDSDPDADTLADFSTVVWFSGDKFLLEGGTGPGPAGPAAGGEDDLTVFLDQGGCLVLSSQDYLWDRGGGGPNLPSAFMEQYLGLASGVDAFQTNVTGTVADDFFDGLGPYDLDYPFGFDNFSDQLSPDLGSRVAFVGNAGDAAIYKEVPSSFDPAVTGFRTAYLGFPLETISTAEGRVEALAAALKLCDLTCPFECPPVAGKTPYHLALRDQEVSTDQTACNSLVLERATVSGTVKLQTGNVVILGNDTAIGSATRATDVTIEIAPVDP